MSLQKFSQEELEQMPMVEIANIVLFDHEEALHYKDIFLKIANAKGYSGDEQIDLFAQFYTDLNMDGRFITTGDNLWGLKRWYPADQIDEQVSNPSMKEEKVTDGDETTDLVDGESTEGDELAFDEDIEDKDFEEFEEDEFPAYTDDDDD